MRENPKRGRRSMRGSTKCRREKGERVQNGEKTECKVGRRRRRERDRESKVRRREERKNPNGEERK